MATTNVKFFKGAYGSSAALEKSKKNVGGIVFDTTSKQIYVDEKAFGGNITDVTFDANKLLTITKADNTTIKLDFSDTASAEATMNVFARLNKVIGKNVIDGGDTLDYTGTNYISTKTNLVDADKELDTQIKAVNDAIAGMDYNTAGTANLATVDGNVISLATTIKQEDGTIAVSGTQALAAVAKTGAAADVTIADAEGVITATTVEGALTEIAQEIDAMDLAATDVVAMSTDGKKLQAGKIKEEDGKVTVETLADVIEFNQALTAENKAATMADITAAGITIDGKKGAITTGDGLTDVGTDDGSFGVATDGYVAIDATSKKVVLDSTKIDSNYTTTNTTNLATVATVKAAVDGLDVTEYEQAVISENKIEIKKIGETNGKIVTTGSTEIPVDGTVSSTNKLATQTSITTAIDGLDNDGETMASETDGVVTIYKTITESNGVIDIDGAKTNAITLAKVATTGSATDVKVNYAAKGAEAAETTVQGAVTGMTTRIADLEALPTYDVVVVGDGDLPTASASTMHKIYLKSETLTSTDNIYGEYITVKGGTTETPAYTWEKLGTTAASLDGYVKTITINGKEYAVTGTTTNIAVGDVITAVSGETAITGGNADYVSVTATTAQPETADGSRTTTLASSVKVQAVSTASDTNKGLAEASDVKSYVDGKVDGLDKDGYAQASVTTDENTNVQTITINGIKEENGVIAADTTKNTTISNVVIDGNYDTVKSSANSALQSIGNGTDGDYVTTTVSEKGTGTTQNVSTALTFATYADDKKTVATDGVAKGSDVVAVADAIAAAKIDALAGSATSDDASVATVKVDTENGEVKDVTVTTISAGVAYTEAKPATETSEATPANLSATTTTGAVTGADIATIKSYVDAKAAEASQTTVEDKGATITVNAADATTLATVAGTDITAKAQLVWEEWS